MNPFLQNDEVEWVQVPATVAKGVDYLAELSKHQSPNGLVETQTDWKILKEVVKVWRAVYPQEAAHFYEGVKKFKSANNSVKGISKEGSAMLLHTLELPEKLYVTLMTMFPNLKFDKEFVLKFVKELPEFYVAKL